MLAAGDNMKILDMASISSGNTVWAGIEDGLNRSLGILQAGNHQEFITANQADMIADKGPELYKYPGSLKIALGLK